MGIRAVFNNVFYSEVPLTEKDYASSRSYSTMEGASARAIFNLTSGAFLAGFASFLGANDRFNGIIAAIPLLAAIVQLFSPIVFEKMEKRKFIITFLCLAHRILLGCMVFIPFFVHNSSLRLVMLAVMYFIAFISVSFITPAVSNWLISLTPDNIRGRYLGVRESYALATATVFTLAMGRVLDYFKNAGSQYTGFLIISCVVLAITLVNFIVFTKMKEPPVRRHKSDLNLKKIITIPLQDIKFRKIILLFVLWNLGLQIGGPFLAVFMVTGLKLNYTYIMVVGVLGTCTHVILARVWGKIADKKSWIFVVKTSIMMLAITHSLWIFVSPATVPFLVPLLHIAGGAAYAGIGISIFNIQFTFSPEEGRTVYVGFNAALGGIIGFSSTIVGSILLGVFSKAKLVFSIFSVGNMQIIFLISGLLLACCSAYVHFFIKQQQVQ